MFSSSHYHYFHFNGRFSGEFSSSACTGIESLAINRTGCYVPDALPDTQPIQCQNTEGNTKHWPQPVPRSYFTQHSPHCSGKWCWSQLCRLFGTRRPTHVSTIILFQKMTTTSRPISLQHAQWLHPLLPRFQPLSQFYTSDLHELSGFSFTPYYHLPVYEKEVSLTCQEGRLAA